VTIRSNMDGENGVKVWLEFCARGCAEKLYARGFGNDGGRERWWPRLCSRAPHAGRRSRAFSADPAYLATSALTIW